MNRKYNGRYLYLMYYILSTTRHQFAVSLYSKWKEVLIWIISFLLMSLWTTYTLYPAHDIQHIYIFSLCQSHDYVPTNLAAKLAGAFIGICRENARIYVSFPYVWHNVKRLRPVKQMPYHGSHSNVALELVDPWGLSICHENYTRAPFYWHGLTLILPWISNYILSKIWDEITYPFLNFNSCTVEV